jgi:hypothetical protein
MDGKRSRHGFLAERGFEVLIGPENLIYHNNRKPECYNWDFKHRKNGLRMEVKECTRTVDPRPNFVASITDLSKLYQDCDVYVFFQVQRDMSICWMMGWMDKITYCDQAILAPKGEWVPNMKQYRKRDCYELPYSEIYPIGDLTKKRYEEPQRKRDNQCNTCAHYNFKGRSWWCFKRNILLFDIFKHTCEDYSNRFRKE